MPSILCPMFCPVLYCETHGSPGYNVDHPLSDVMSCILLWDLRGALVIMPIILCLMFCPVLYCCTYVEPW